jgi:hypothetical protein
MRIKSLFTRFAPALLALAVLNARVGIARAQGTAFTYQGRLSDGALVANGSYDLKFTLFDASTGGSQVGTDLTNSATAITNGMFNVALNFGAGIFTGSNYWLSISVRTNGTGAFTALSPLEPILPVPYAIYASNSAVAATADSVALGSVNSSSILDGTITAENIGTGQVVKSLNGLRDAVTLAAGANISLATNGSTLTVAGLAGTGGGWGLSGNAGTTTGSNYVGTTDNQPLELHANGQRVLRLEPTTVLNTPNVIGGSSSEISSTAATIGGGYFNLLQANRESTIAGGWENTIQSGANFSTIGGGGGNTNASVNSTIAGGVYNQIQSIAGDSFIGGGISNLVQVDSFASTIAGGFQNSAANAYTSIGGGGNNTNSGNTGTIAGGAYNVIGISSESSIGGGIRNIIKDTSDFSTIAGGESNLIDSYELYATISGGLSNYIGTTLAVEGGSVIAGGAFNNVLDANQGFCTISGGYSNSISYDADFAVIGGGNENSIGSGGPDYQSFSTICGGSENTIQPNSTYSTIAGGSDNVVGAPWAVIAGGLGNDVTNSSPDSFVGAGTENVIDSSPDSALGGGRNNVIWQSGASMIGGGLLNLVSNATWSAIGGGEENIVTGGHSVIPGGDGNIAAGNFCFAAGHLAFANYDSSFVWSDGGMEATNTAADQFVVAASGGTFINTSVGSGVLNVGGDVNIQGGLYIQEDLTVTNDLQVVDGSVTAGGSFYGASLHLLGDIQAAGNAVINGNLAVGGTVTAKNIANSSDRNIKEHIMPIDSAAILDKVASLPISSWNFKTDDPFRHIGPMAQDFYAAFNVGPDERHITTVDEGGVALAAIQGLNQRVEKQNEDSHAEIQALREQNRALEERLHEMETTLKLLADRK